MLQGIRLEPCHHSTSAVRLEDGVLISAANWLWRCDSAVGGQLLDAAGTPKPSSAFHAGFFFADLLTRFARLSFVLRLFRVLKDALWVSAEPYRGVPAKPTRAPFFITATNKAAALLLFYFSAQTAGLSLPGVVLTAVRHTDVLQPLSVHGGASRRVGRAPRVSQARYIF